MNLGIIQAIGLAPQNDGLLLVLNVNTVSFVEIIGIRPPMVEKEFV